jgi:hypothetical protein
MDLNSITAQTTTLAQQAAKGGLHTLWTFTAAHPRFATVVGLSVILASGVVGFAIGVRA